MNEMPLTQREIALILGVSASTIKSRTQKKYRSKQGRYTKGAHKLALQRRKDKSKHRISVADWEMVEGYISTRI